MQLQSVNITLSLRRALCKPRKVIILFYSALVRCCRKDVDQFQSRMKRETTWGLSNTTLNWRS